MTKPPYSQREEKLKAWAKLNGLKQTFSSFYLRDGNWKRATGNLDLLPHGCDHSRWFIKNGKPYAVVTEPYGELVVSPAYRVDVPPIHPKASFYWPGHTYLYVLRKFDEQDPIVWLKEQVYGYV